jgi:hypothetical protein
MKIHDFASRFNSSGDILIYMQNRYIRKKPCYPGWKGLAFLSFILSHVIEYLNITHHFHDNKIALKFEFSNYGTNSKMQSKANLTRKIQIPYITFIIISFLHSKRTEIQRPAVFILMPI